MKPLAAILISIFVISFVLDGGRLTVRVLSNKRPVAGAVVSMDSLHIESVTDTAGYAYFMAIPEGSQVFTVRAGGYLSFTRHVRIHSTLESNVTIHLQPKFVVQEKRDEDFKETGTGVFELTAISQEGKPVAGASVSNDSLHVTGITNGSGYAMISLPAGKHVIAVRAKGFCPYLIYNIKVFNMYVTRADIHLQPDTCKSPIIDLGKNQKQESLEIGDGPVLELFEEKDSTAKR